MDLDLIYFGGGEPFTQFPLLLRAVNLARKLGFNVGVATNGFFARSVDAGIRYLRPLANMGIREVCISNDFFHYKNPETSPAIRALEAAQKLNLNTKWAFISEPGTEITDVDQSSPTLEVTHPRLMFAGRAADTLTVDLSSSSWISFNCCPRSDLNQPEQIYIDATGNAQICPGIAIGNAWEQPLHAIIDNFHSANHAILGPLAEGGPAKLIRTLNIEPNMEYVDACHCCYSIRRDLIDQYPNQLAPRHIYGL